jgi:GR25 family glycosyltransferase involved in LPS biosynthesis
MIQSIHVIHIDERIDRLENIHVLSNLLKSEVFNVLLNSQNNDSLEKLTKLQKLENIDIELKQEHLKDITKKKDLHIFSAIRQKDGRKGCYESHIQVMKKALLQNPNKCALIFEDDAEFAKDVDKSLVVSILDQTNTFTSTEKFDILFLGSFPNVFVANDTIRVSKFKNIYKTSPATTHAYIASPQFMKRMTESFYEFEGVAIDDFYKSKFINTFAIYPSIFMQSISKSDIASPLAAFISSFKLKNSIWRLAELYSTSVSFSLKHVLFVTFFMCILFIQISSFK